MTCGSAKSPGRTSRIDSISGPTCISEYVDVAKAFFDADESGMVNAVLDRIARDSRGDETKPRAAVEGGGGEEGSS